MLQKSANKLSSTLSGGIKRYFGAGGPYNPYRYKDHMAPSSFPKNEEIFNYLREAHTMPRVGQRNMRHILPVRESGPLPAYDGTYTMEDIRNIYDKTCVGRDFHPCSHLPEEIMRRVPGLTRKEAEHITRLGLTPDEEIDYAYLAYNLGLDVFYLANQIYTTRQVVTNSKGERVEVYWNAQVFEDLAYLNVGFAPTMEHVDYHWEIFLWGDAPIHPLVDFDLSVPNTWFEYECEWWGEQTMIEDQMSLPDTHREFPSPKHENANRTLWQSQDKQQELSYMEDPEWFPEGTEFNIYNQPGWKKPAASSLRTSELDRTRVY